MAVQDLLKVRWFLGGALVLAGAAHLAFPVKFVNRAYILTATPTDDIHLIHALGILLTGAGLAVFTDLWEDRPRMSFWALPLAAALSIFYFLTLTLHLQDWWIDDAGITFAYSRSLAEGSGLVAQPWLPPEEGYSSSTWMLLLSFMARLGVDIPMAAKYLGIGFSAASMALCAVILARQTRSPLTLFFCGAGIATAPTVVWAASGQEHALQAFILLGIVFCVWLLERWRWPVAVALALFVLTRPEAPVIVIAVFLAAVFLTRRAGGPLVNAADIAVALIPFVAFLGLLAFRVLYFGDLFPNPYYAKSSAAGLLGLFNIMGLGWSYVVSGLRDTALLLAIPLIFMMRLKQLPAWIIVALAILGAQLFFVVWAKGDWMAQYRFLMPILPIALLLAALGLGELRGFTTRALCVVLIVLALAQTNAQQLALFKANPPTPFAAVTDVGNTFSALADRLEIEDPVLAHHDAGGIAYHRMIRLVDLGGLISRTIAKNMDDKAFLTAYLLEDIRPDFVFGSRNFAAASGFAETAAFAREYVRLEFADMPAMTSDLSYVRRDLIDPASDLELVYDTSGALQRVLVFGQW